MSISARPLLTPGVALATAGAIALAPMMTPLPSQALAEPVTVVPTMHIENVQLAGFGQDIYYAITPWVQYGVSLASYGVGFVPIVGPPLADQININYFQGIQPIVEATVNYAAGVVQHPLNFFPTTAAYGNALFGIGYYYVSAQLQFWSLPPLPPIVLSAPAGSASATFADASGPADIPPSVAPGPKRAHKRLAAPQAGAETDAVAKSAKPAKNEAHTAIAGSKGEARTGAKDARASAKVAHNEAN